MQFQDNSQSGNGINYGRGNNQRRGNFTKRDSYQDEVFSWKVKAGPNRSYFLNLKKDRNGKFYLIIKEVKYVNDNSMGGQQVKNSFRIMLFEEDMGKFMDGMGKIIEYITANGGDISSPTPEKDILPKPEEGNSNFDTTSLKNISLN